jgi:exopolysaccharide biosynthesis operon protein EpsL
LGTLIALVVRILAFVAISGVGLWQQVACADEGDVFRPYVGLTSGYDSNLRRFSNKDVAEASTGSRDTADTYLRKEVGIILDKQISLQKFYADVSVNETSYNQNSDIDNTGKSMLARWNWRLGTHLEGNMLISHDEAMVPFADFRGMALNLRTIDRQSFDAVWRFHPRWQVRSLISDSKTDYSDISQRSSRLNESAKELGLDYLFPTMSKVGLQFRNVDGDRPDPQQVGTLLIDNSYTQNELKLAADWMYSGKTRIQFLGGGVERSHKEFSNRDFKGINSRLNFDWMMTGKTSLNSSIWREINGQSYVTSSYVLSKGASVSLNWMATSKIVLQATTRYDESSFEGDSGNSSREDINRYHALSVNYRPLNDLTLTGLLNRSIRESTVSNLGYKSTGLVFNVRYEF